MLECMGLKLGTEGAYSPREDSLLLAEALEGLLREGMEVLDLGCGSGLMALIAARKGCRATAADISPEAVRTAWKNAELNNLSIRCLVSDLFDNISDDFDLIVFNLPYLPEKITEDSREWAAGERLELVERFIGGARECLKARGSLLIAISSHTGLGKVMEMLGREGFTAKVAASKKIPWEELMVIRADL